LRAALRLAPTQPLNEAKVEILSIKVGRRLTIETLINKEAFLFVKYLRNEKETWIPRVKANLN